MPIPLFQNLSIVGELTDHNGRHVVFDGPHARHRVLFRHSHPRTDSGFAIAPDAWLDTRLSAVRALIDDSRLRNGQMAGPELRPTDYQRQRLVLLLRILDRRYEQPAQPPSLRQIAGEIVFPGTDFGRAIEWKSSSHRRQVQRLSHEAQQLMNGGYRALLEGRTG